MRAALLGRMKKTVGSTREASQKRDEPKALDQFKGAQQIRAKSQKQTT
jgi:hypothetical protein